MASLLGSIVRRACRNPGDRLNVLLARGDLDDVIASTGHDIYAVGAAWEAAPQNVMVLDTVQGMAKFPPEVDFDLVVATHGGPNYLAATNVAPELQVPLVVIYHSPPAKHWTKERIGRLRGRSGDLNVATSAATAALWHWPEGKAYRLIQPNDLSGWCELLEEAASMPRARGKRAS